MFVKRDHHSLVFGAVAFSPDGSKGNEEALLGCVAVNQRAGFSCAGFFKRSESNGESAEVSDAFTHHELAIFVKVALNGVGIELLDDAFGSGLEIFGVIGSPPIAQIALRVELPALIVKTVSHFMADSRADAAVVERVIRFGIKEGMLKN